MNFKLLIPFVMFVSLWIISCTAVQTDPDWNALWKENASARLAMSSDENLSSSSEDELESSSSVFQTIDDTVEISGVSYPTVRIGDQEWFARNVNEGVATDPAGDQIAPELERYCLNGNAQFCTEATGALYQWSEALDLQDSCDSLSCKQSGDVQGICPDGWRIPDSLDFVTLFEAMADSGVTSAKVGEALRVPSFGSGTDLFGFSVYSTGFRADSTETSISTAIQLRTRYTGFWTSQESVKNPKTNAMVLILTESLAEVSFIQTTKQDGYALRCMRDVP